MSNCAVCVPSVTGCTVDPIYSTPGLHPGVPFYEMYTLSFYWALSTMSSLGYGQGPKSSQVTKSVVAEHVMRDASASCM